MDVIVELAPREYVSWLRVSRYLGPPVGEVVDALTRTRESRHRWLAGEAERHLHFRIGRRDAGELQRALDAELRVTLESSLANASGAARPGIAAALAFRSYLPMHPVGRELVTAVETVLSESRASKRPAAWSAEGDLVARAVHRCTGTVRVAPLGSFDGEPTPRVLADLSSNLKVDARHWARWCNLITIHQGWAKGQISCLRAASDALPQSDRERIQRWLDEPDWFSTPARRALVGQFRVESYALTPVSLESW